jgi:hypothetical protein
MKTIIDKKWYRTDTFEVVDEFPSNYVVWNIGRQNFPHKGYIPLAEIDSSFDDLYHIKTETLKTLFVGEELSDFIIESAGRKTINKKEFEKITNYRISRPNGIK